MENAELFHIIADADCAEVRKFLVDQNLTGPVNFRNAFYESHAEALQKLTGSLDVPVLVLTNSPGNDSANEPKILKGKTEILSFLKDQKS